MRTICLIPARSGSKGLTDKNMQFLDKKHLIFHTIEAALGCFDKKDIFVSTDSQLYKEICETKGVQVILRPKHLATDTTTTYEVNVDFLQQFDDNDIFVLLQPTSPFRDSADIQNALDIFLNSEADHVVSYTKSEKSPEFFVTLDKEGFVQGGYGLDKGYRRQDQEIYYKPNGAIFISTKGQYLKDKSYFTDKTQAYIMSKRNSLDIDDELDFKYAIATTFFDYKIRESRRKEFYRNEYKKFADNKPKKIVVGDCRSDGIKYGGYENISIGGMTLHTFLENWELFESNLESVIVTAGVNDFITDYDVESIKNSFIKLITNCKSKDIKLGVALILVTAFRTVDNRKIIEFNQWLEKTLKDYDIPYVNPNIEMSVDGRLRLELANDGLHFTDLGLKIYASIVEKLVEK